MNKIKFGEQTFELTPMNIIEDNITKRRIFTFQTNLDYVSVQTLLTNTDNTANIQYLSEDNIILATYSDCVSLKVLSKNYEASTYTAEFSTNTIELQIKQMQEQIDTLLKVIN